MRWKGLIALAVLLAIPVLLGVFFADRWIGRGMEKAGEALLGARVDIDGFHLNLFNGSVSWNRFQAANPDLPLQNLAETGRAAFRVSVPALLRKRVVVQEMTLSDLRSGSPRATSGALPEKKKPAVSRPGPLDRIKARLQADIASMPVFTFDLSRIRKNINVDSLVPIAGLRMPGRLDSVKTAAVQTAAGWDAFFQTFKPDSDLARIRNDFKNVDPRQVKTVPELLVLLEKIQSAQKDVQAISDTARGRYTQLTQDYGRLTSYPSLLNAWYQEDYRRILAKAELPDLSVKQVGKMVFGPILVERTVKAIGYFQTVRSLIPQKQAKPEKESHPRLKGQSIHYADRHGWPSFAIGKMVLSGQTGPTDGSSGYRLEGEARDISSQPWITGRPAVVSISGDKPDGRAVKWSAVLDHRTEEAVDSVRIRFEKISLSHLPIGQSPYLPSQIKHGSADIDWRLRFDGNTVRVGLDAAAQGLDFDFDSLSVADNTFVRVLRDAIRGLPAVTFSTRIQGVGDCLSVRMDSNLDEAVPKELERIGSRALADAQNKIHGRLAVLRDAKTSELDPWVGGKQKAYEKRLSAVLTLTDEQKQLVQEKIKRVRDELDKRTRNEQDRLGKTAKDLLDGVLKKK